MLKKIKKFMVVAAAAIMLSVGFATAAPNEAHAAHWADKQMNWAMNRGYITADLRDNLATRQDAWLILTRAIKGQGGYDYNYARQFLGYLDVTDGTRGTNWVTRDEMAGMLYQYRLKSPAWSPETGFYNSNNWAKSAGIFDGTRGNAFATRAEVVSMIYNASINGKLKRV